MIDVKRVSEENIGDLYRACIPSTEEYGEAVEESGDFFLGKKEKGWKGLVAYESGKAVGRVEFSPLEESFAGISGEDLYFMPCIYIMKDHREKGYGGALMEEVLSETSNSKGLVTVTCEGWMPRRFFEKFGFGLIEQMGSCHLMLKKHKEDARAELLSSSFTPRNEQDKVNIEAVVNCQCPFMTVNYNSLLRKAGEVSDKVEVTQYLLANRDDLRTYGEMNLYIDGEAPFVGPGKDEDIERLVKERLAKKGL